MKRVIRYQIMCFLGGAALLYIGCGKWSVQQKRIDEIQRVESERVVYDWEQMSTSEKEDEIERENRQINFSE